MRGFPEPELSCPSQDEECRLRIFSESDDDWMSLAQECLDIHRSAVAKPNPNYLRRRASQKTPLTKIIVLRYDRKSVVGRIRPNCFIVSGIESEVADMC